MRRIQPVSVVRRYYRLACVGQSGKPLRYVVSLSGGASSAVAGDIILNTVPRESVELVFADTLWEDSDNWRFLGDLMVRYQMSIRILRDGRTPLQVAEDERIIPNDMLATCTKRLKTELIRDYVLELQRDYEVRMVIGYDHKDAAPRKRGNTLSRRGRLDGAVKNWTRYGIQCVFPLMEPGAIVHDPKAVVRSWGISLPRAYAMGFSHANCGGRCVKQGQADWRRLLINHPDRFAQVEAWEARMRARGGKYASRALLTRVTNGQTVPYTLAELRHDVQQTGGQRTLWEIEEQLYERTCGIDCNVFGDDHDA